MLPITILNICVLLTMGQALGSLLLRYHRSIGWPLHLTM
jgi:hypothetical protein